MNSLYVIEGDGGGAVTHVLTLASHFEEAGINCLIAFLCDGPSVETARRLGLRFCLVEKRLPLDPGPVGKLVHIVHRNRVDVIHSHTIRGNFYGRMTALLCRIPIVSLTTVHSHIVDELRGKKSFGIWDHLLWYRERCMWPQVDHFICVSEELKERLLSNGMDEGKISVIENGVPIPDLAGCHHRNRSVRKEFGISEGECIVTTVGRLVPVKNHIFFLRMAREISRRKKHVRFLIIGDGELLEFLQGKAREWGLVDRVIFAGWRNDISRLLCATDIYAICSFIEGLNLSILEAMAHGIPVVGTDVKGISNLIVDEVTGRLIPLDDVGAMVQSITELIESSALVRKMGSNARDRVRRRYSVEAMVNATESLYAQLNENKEKRGM